MADTPDNQAPTTPQVSVTTRQKWLRGILPHVLTAAVAIGLSLAIQAAMPQPNTTPAPAPTIPIATPSPAPTIAPTALPLPTAPIPASGITRQEVLDLRAEDDRIWTAIYLSRAINQIADAESALRVNDMERAGQMLIATDDSLALAYTRTPNTLRDPIAQLRRDAGGLHADLFLRPENMDMRLASLRQTLLALIAERG